MELQGRVALVTGGAVRLGRAFVEALAAKGAHVAIHYAHSQAAAEEVKARVEALGVRAALVRAGLEDPLRAGEVLGEARQALGPVDILVNNAAIFEPGNLRGTSDQAWDRHQHINLRAPFILSRAFAAQGRAGKIVNILDWRALRPGREHLAYTVAKAGLAALTRSMALTLAPAVQVNGLALGAILPPARAEEAELAGIIRRVPAGRWGTPQEVALALLFLLEGPDYITGEILHVDGGRHLA